MATEAKHIPATEEQTSQAQLALEGMTCAACAMRIEKGLKKVPGVKEASVNLATEQANITYDPEQTGIEQMVKKVEAVGYKAAPLANTRVEPVAVNATVEASVPITGVKAAIQQEDERS